MENNFVHLVGSYTYCNMMHCACSVKVLRVYRTTDVLIFGDCYYYYYSIILLLSLFVVIESGRTVRAGHVA